MKTRSRIITAAAVLWMCGVAPAQDIVFDFNTDGDYHGFVDFMNRVANDSVAGGQLSGVTASGDTQFRKFSTDGAAVGDSNNFSFAIADYSDIEIIVSVDYGNDGLADTDGGPGNFSVILYSGNPIGDPASVNPTEPTVTASQVLPLSGDTGFNTYTIPLSSFDLTNTEFDLGVIEGIRFDAVNGPGSNPSSFSIDSIRLISAPDGVLGDFDADDDVDLADLDEYNQNLDKTVADNPELANLDLNGDGTIDTADFQQHYETLVETSNGGKGTFGGDADLNGAVNVLGDAFQLVANLGQPATSWSQGDFNADGTVDVLGDAFLLVANLGADNGGVTE